MAAGGWERVFEQQKQQHKNTPRVGWLPLQGRGGKKKRRIKGNESHITSGWGLWGGGGGGGQSVITDRGLIHVAHMLGLLWGPMVGRAHSPLSVRLMDFGGIWEAFQV